MLDFVSSFCAFPNNTNHDDTEDEVEFAEEI